MLGLSALYRPQAEPEGGMPSPSSNLLELKRLKIGLIGGPGRIRTGDLRRVRAASCRAGPPAQRQFFLVP